MRSSKNTLNTSLKKQVYGLLEQVIVDIKTSEDAKLFLSDFLKESEYEMLAKRIAIAYWLKKGRSYANIKQNLKVSSATIASVQQEIDKKGIQFAVKLMEADEWASKWADKFKKFTGK